MIAALIRHGDYHQLADTPSAHQPFALTAAGEEQSRAAGRALGAMLSREGWSLVPSIDCSRMLRSWQTARIIAEELKGQLPSEPLLESFDELAERGLGSGANLTIRQIETILLEDPRFFDPPPDWKSNSHYRLPLQGAESLMDAGERVAAHIRQSLIALTQEERKDRLKLFVGHGAAFRHAAYHLGLLEYGQIAELSMYHAQPIFIEYRQNGQWCHIGGEWKVRTKRDRALD
ncbi:MAG: histidine phosphatase family protein [Sedimenticola sp.]